MSLQDSFKGKNILVTGAGRGIGLELSRRLYSYGAKVFALGKNPDRLQKLKTECPKIQTICVDLSKWEDTRQVISKLEAMDGVINNAAVGEVISLMNSSEDVYNRVMDVNVKGTFNVSQLVAQKMIEAGNGGSIVNISSVGGTKAFVLFGCYCVSKAALEMMTKLLSVELGPHKIRVNAVQPATCDTDMLVQIREGVKQSFGSEEAWVSAMRPRTPYGEMIMPMDQVVNTILFMLSDLAPQITGQILAIDGGFLNT